MLSLNLGRLFSRPPPLSTLPAEPQEGPPPVPSTATAQAHRSIPLAASSQAAAWPPARLTVNDRLWGTGFTAPGGEPEILRLVRPLGATADNRLLLVGMGAGGPAKAILDATQTTLTGLEAEPALLAAATTLLADIAPRRRLRLGAWDPARPDFAAAHPHHNALALEPMRHAAAATVLPALTAAIAPGGSVVVTSLVAIEPIDPADTLIARWAHLERRDPALLPPPAQVADLLGAEGLDLRIAEDISQRHMDQILQGWRHLMSEVAAARPDRAQSAAVVAEAEQWLLRRRLIDGGRLRMMRWHTIRRR